MKTTTSIDTDRAPAIALARGPTGLGIVRSLQMAQIPVYAACPPDDMVTYSRWYRPTPGRAAWDGAIGPAPRDALRDIPLEQAVLIPGADDAALWLADIPGNDLSGRFRVSTSSRRTLEILQDKVQFATFLADTDIPYPRTFSIGSRADIEAIPFDELDRVFIKPANSQKFSDAMSVKGIWVHSRQELVDTWQDLDEKGFKVMAQEYVPGSAADHYFVDGFRDRHGTLTGLFARRRERIFPAGFGNSSYCRSIPLADAQGPVDSVTRLLEKLHYRGIFSAEFKQDARDGKFRILEVNTRAWTYVEFASRCGVNVCEMAYQDALEHPVTRASPNYPVGVGCVNLYRDINCVTSQSAAIRGPLRKVLAQWVSAHFHVFRLDDPKPGLSVARRLVARRLGWHRKAR